MTLMASNQEAFYSRPRARRSTLSAPIAVLIALMFGAIIGTTLRLAFIEHQGPLGAVRTGIAAIICLAALIGIFAAIRRGEQ